MPADLSREARIYLALWRKCLREDGLVVKLQTYNQALALRLALYRTLKPYRESEFLDPELYQAGQKYCIGVPKDNNTLHFTDRKSLLAAEAAYAALGLSDSDLYSDDELMVQARMSEELDKLVVKDLPVPKAPATPAPNTFYSRD